MGFDKYKIWNGTVKTRHLTEICWQCEHILIVD